MLPYSFYKIVHILGIALALVSLGGFAVHALNGGAKSDNRARTLLIAMHGTGAFLILASAGLEMPMKAVRAPDFRTTLGCAPAATILLSARCAPQLRRA